MRGIGANREQLPPGTAGAEDISVAQLITLQKQIIELVDQNTEARRECLLLRQQVAREAEAIYCRSRSLPRRLLRAIARLLRPLGVLARLANLTGRPGASTGIAPSPSPAAAHRFSRALQPARPARAVNPLHGQRPELRLISCPSAHAESR